MFSGKYKINDVLEDAYFQVNEESKFGADPICEVTSVEVLYEKKSTTELISEGKINLANFGSVRSKYNEQIEILYKKDEEGRSGIRLLDK